MVFLLTSENIFNYLIDRKLCQKQETNLSRIEAKICKNFNLLVYLSDDRCLLVKQEPHDRNGETKGDLLHEWKVHQLLQTDPNLQPLLKFVSEIIDFDPHHAIVVANYLHHYHDLSDFYSHHCIFPVKVAAAIGDTLARFHRATFDRSDYQQFLEPDDPALEDDDQAPLVPSFSLELEQLIPEVFGQVSEEGLKFYALYQRYESLRQAIDQLQQNQEPCCLTHQDLKFNNILLHHHWQDRGDRDVAPLKVPDHHSSMIRLIDWEKWAWGDPASDVGMLIAEYLKLWLKSLGLRSGLDINLALQLAGIPLEQLQPSIVSLTQAYLTAFPEVVDRFPDFLSRVIQFTGLALIEGIQAKLYYREPFGNTEIGMLQVAKTLLCDPKQSIPTVFGRSVSELLDGLQSPSSLHQSVARSIQTDQPQNQRNGLRSVASHKPAIELSELEFALLNGTQVQMLQDLIQQIQIRPEGVFHPHYPRPELEVVQSDRLQRLPVDLQQHYLQIQLRNLLYDLYFSGELRLNAWREAAGLSLENNAVAGLNIHFFDEIQANNHGSGYWDEGWRVVRQGVDGRYAVQKEELTLYVDPQQHLPVNARSPQIDDIVAIRLPKHRMDGDFYVAVGDAGLVPDDRLTLEIWFHVKPVGAKALMHHLTTHLNEKQIPFSFKVLSNPEDYGRYDAGVLYLECQHYSVLRPILQEVYIHNRSQFYPAIPLFMKPIAPGIGLAEQPEESEFGMHRCQQVANALLKAWKQQQNTCEQRLIAIQQQLLEQGINWESLYLNDKHKDDYEPIES